MEKLRRFTHTCVYRAGKVYLYGQSRFRVDRIQNVRMTLDKAGRSYPQTDFSTFDERSDIKLELDGLSIEEICNEVFLSFKLVTDKLFVWTLLN